KLPPGAWVKIDLQQRQISAPEIYWSAAEVAKAGCENPLRISDEEAVTLLDGLLRDVVAGQVVADVPLGAFLSGGVDSSTIVGLMQAQTSKPVRTFTIGFEEEKYNEAAHAARVALHLGTEHTEFYVTGKQALGVVPKLPGMFDEPFADASQ